MTQRVLCILANGVEEIEWVTPVDILRRAGAEVVIASVEETLKIRGRNGLVFYAECFLQDVLKRDYAMLLLPGGPAVMQLRTRPEILALIQQFAVQQKMLAAICAAPLLLRDAGVLKGRSYTSHFSTAAELPDRQLSLEVVEDGNLITSRGAGTALAFALTLVKRLFEPELAHRIAEQVDAY